MRIEDASGKNYGLKVNADNQAEVFSVSVAKEAYFNIVKRKMFSMTFDAIDPAGADDYFFYLKNTGTEEIQIIDYTFRSTVAGSIEVHNVSGTPVYVGETAVTPVNRYLGSANELDATINTDTDITGLTSLGVLFYSRLALTDTDYKTDIRSRITIPAGQAIAILWDTATGALTATLSAYETKVI